MAQIWDPHDDVAEQWYDKAIAQRRRKHYEKALACFDRALALVPRKGTWWYWKGVTECDLKHYENALACFDRALKIESDDADSVDYRAYALFKLTRYKEALTAYERALVLAPTRENLWYWKGETLRNLKRDEDALACYDQALALKTTSTRAAHSRADALGRLQRYEEAVAAYDVALTLLSPKEDSNLIYSKGISLGYLKRHEEALACFDRILELSPDDTQAVKARVEALFNLQRDEEMIVACDAALKLVAPEERIGLISRKSIALRRLNRDQDVTEAYHQALEVCRDILTLDENNAEVWRQSAEINLRLKRHGEALLAADRAIALDEKNVFGWKLKGNSLYKLGRYQETLSTFEHVLQLAPLDGQAWEFKGAVLYRLGRYKDAESAYDEALRLRPDDPKLREYYEATMRSIRRTTTDQRLMLHDGRWLGYLDYGDPHGTPVICFHGTPSSRLESFADDDLLNELHIRLIVPDRPGYGLSDFQRHRRLLDWPADVMELADHLGLERFAVLGVSGGAPHAAACAYAIPDRLTCVGVVSSPAPPEISPRIRDLPPRSRLSLMLGRYLPWLLLFSLYTPFSWLTRMFPRMARAVEYSRSLSSNEEGRAAIDAAWELPRRLPPVEYEQITEPYRHGARGHTWDIRLCDRRWGFLPAAIQGVEVYLWHGERDLLAPAMMGHALAATIPGCHATFYPDEAHNVYSQHTREILATLAGPAHEQSSASGKEPGA